MKNVIKILCIALLISSCGNDKSGKKTYLPASQGSLNTIFVVSDNNDWQGEIGETIRSIFAAPIVGLPQDEPMFKLHQISPKVFKGKANKNRIILKIENQSDSTSTKINNNVYAKPQTVAVIQGKTEAEITAQLTQNKHKIIDAFNKQEIKEKQRRIKLSLLNVKSIEAQLGATLQIPSVYKIEKKNNNFFWIRKGLDKYKTVDVMLYQTPLENIRKGDSAIVDIIKLRNRITKTQVPGEDGMFMAVQEAYAPALFKTIIDNKTTYEVRGLWDMKGATMAGCFIMYVIEDKINNRYLIADGYVYAPSLEKSKYVFELEAILKSINIK